MSDIRKLASDELKQILRKTKTLPANIKTIVYQGCKDPRASIQFNEDIRLYGLWEALLYVENYEQDGSASYVEGTAEKAIQHLLNRAT